jgi:ankyrin repeat protein
MRNIDPPREIARWSGVTPDYMFVYSSRTRAGESIATALLQSKAVTNVDVVPPGEQGTALVSAAMGNHAQLAAKLISAGANVNAEHTSDKRTPLVIFTMNRNLQAVQLLTAKGARVNHVDGYGHPLLQYAMEAEASARDPAIPITRHLLKVGANPSIPNRYGLDFTMAATRQLSLPAVKLMIEEYKANPNLHTPPPNNISLLTTAAITSAVGVDSSSLVQYLLNKGASPWVQWNGSDILRTLENNPDPSTFTYYAKNAALIKDARKRSSKPAGFQEYIQGPPQQR